MKRVIGIIVFVALALSATVGAAILDKKPRTEPITMVFVPPVEQNFTLSI